MIVVFRPLNFALVSDLLLLLVEDCLFSWRERSNYLDLVHGVFNLLNSPCQIHVSSLINFLQTCLESRLKWFRRFIDSLHLEMGVCMHLHVDRNVNENVYNCAFLRARTHASACAGVCWCVLVFVGVCGEQGLRHFIAYSQRLPSKLESLPWMLLEREREM